jgi:AraC-like DNA-binding protein
MRKYIDNKNLYDLMNGRNLGLKEVGTADISSQKSDSEIVYYRWDLEFDDDTDAKKENNLGIDEVQIIFNLNQDIEWIVGENENDKKYQVVSMKKGDVCIYRNDNIGTSMCYKKGINFKFKSLQMHTKRFAELLKTHFSEDEIKKIEAIVYDSVQMTRITPEMYRILSELDSADRYKEFKGVFLDAKMTELTALVLFEIVHSKDETYNSVSLRNNSDSYAVEKLREDIQLTPFADYDAESVAAKLSMSVSKLNRIFRELYGTSLHAYVQEMRLEQAAEMLLKMNLSVTEVAVNSGYNNMSHFSKAFKNRFGITPKKFSERKVLKKDL